MPRKGYITIEHKIRPCFHVAAMYVLVFSCTSLHHSTLVICTFYTTRTFQLTFQFQAVLVGWFGFLEAGPVAGSCLTVVLSGHDSPSQQANIDIAKLNS